MAVLYVGVMIYQGLKMTLNDYCCNKCKYTFEAYISKDRPCIFNAIDGDRWFVSGKPICPKCKSPDICKVYNPINFKI